MRLIAIDSYVTTSSVSLGRISEGTDSPGHWTKIRPKLSSFLPLLALRRAAFHRGKQRLLCRWTLLRWKPVCCAITSRAVFFSSKSLMMLAASVESQMEHVGMGRV